MKTTIKIATLLLITFYFIGCQKQPSLEGMWLVEKVSMGEQFMTPIARWMRFNSDNTQVSGNGWFQHSYGTWSLENNQLSVEDTNGINSNPDPFSVEIQENTMTWTRIEDGQEVIVSLKRTDQLPQSGGNKLKGLWKLTSATDDGNDITAVLNPDQKSMLHLRWDNTYVQHNMPQGKNYGVYKIHGHKPEIQLVNYGNESKFSFWSFEFAEEKLTLMSTDNKSVMTFERITDYLN
jgi:uncharacterized lipoprotein NlpE involved in copper resistance